MEKEFVPYELALRMKQLGFDKTCFGFYDLWDNSKAIGGNYPCDGTNSAPLYQQAFRWFREKYEFTYSIGKTNIAVIHYGPTTQLLQNNDSYEAAELAAIKWFIDVAKQQKNAKDK
jgi:hypothetical protein